MGAKKFRQAETACWPNVFIVDFFNAIYMEMQQSSIFCSASAPYTSH